ncbi:MAG: FIST N-terminal domain-containing protein, partial [Motiliproteus sp.]
MQALSISSQASDPYRAGIELGEGLAPLSPEIIFVFSTVHYGHSSELLEGLADSLDDSDVVVVGNTGDGYYHQDDCGDVGCVAMGLNSGGKVRWRYSTFSGVNADPEGCLLKAWSALQDMQDEEPRLLFMFSDFRTDASLFEKVLREQIKVPVVGGIAADDNQMVDCAVYAGDRCMRDSLV